MTGNVGILNVGAGDTKLVFDPNNPQDMIRAARIVKDMIRRGYALLIEMPQGDGKPSTYRRAYDFDERTCEYIIADFDPVVAQEADKAEAKAIAAAPAGGLDEGVRIHGQEGAEEAGASSETVSEASAPAKKSRRRSEVRIAATSTGAIAVARTAGG